MVFDFKLMLTVSFQRFSQLLCLPFFPTIFSALPAYHVPFDFLID